MRCTNNFEKRKKEKKKKKKKKKTKKQTNASAYISTNRILSIVFYHKYNHLANNSCSYILVYTPTPTQGNAHTHTSLRSPTQICITVSELPIFSKTLSHRVSLPSPHLPRPFPGSHLLPPPPSPPPPATSTFSIHMLPSKLNDPYLSIYLSVKPTRQALKKPKDGRKFGVKISFQYKTCLVFVILSLHDLTPCSVLPARCGAQES